MAARPRWLRLNIDWSEDPWLDTLPWDVRACWPEWLCIVKSTGHNGVIPVTPIHRLAGSRNIPSECFQKLLDAAIAEGAVIVQDGQWVTKNWKRYQEGDSTNAERQRRYREGDKEPENDNAVMSVTSEEITPDNTVTLSRVTTRPLDSKTEENSTSKIIPTISHVVLTPDRSPWNEFCSIYPKRSGALNKAKAEPKFSRLARDHPEIIAGVRRYRAWCDATGKTGTEYVKQMDAWLNGRLWLEEFEVPGGVTLINERDRILEQLHGT